MKKIKVDLMFLVSLFLLTAIGFLVFSSASLGLLSKHSIKYANVAFNQTFFGLFLGSIACIITANIPYTFYKKNAFWIFLFSIILTALVFLPGLGIEHGGAKRWLDMKVFTFQPGEILKIAYIMYLCAWIASVKNKVEKFTYGMLPFFLITAVVGAIFLAQPDTDTFIIALTAGVSVLFVSGVKWRHIFLIFIIALLGIGTIAFTRPYVMSRITTFLNPELNGLSSGYQIQQSLIAVGSGGVYGRGFGQSVQKFDFLPEPIGDSIFAVFAEEFGFFGSIFLILLFVFFSIRGLKISSQAPDVFGRLLSLGIVILIISQTFVNIGAMVGILPLSGITLPFVSHGGTSLFIALAEAGIILNISKSIKK
jgi:cell division protein FtsW